MLRRPCVVIGAVAVAVAQAVGIRHQFSLLLRFVGGGFSQNRTLMVGGGPVCSTCTLSVSIPKCLAIISVALFRADEIGIRTFAQRLYFPAFQYPILVELRPYRHSITRNLYGILDFRFFSRVPSLSNTLFYRCNPHAWPRQLQTGRRGIPQRIVAAWVLICAPTLRHVQQLFQGVDNLRPPDGIVAVSDPGFRARGRRASRPAKAAFVFLAVGNESFCALVATDASAVVGDALDFYGDLLRQPDHIETASGGGGRKPPFGLRLRDIRFGPQPEGEFGFRVR